MNFRYLLQTFNSLAEISLSLNTFPRTFGIYTTDTKRIILQMFCNYGGRQLKKIRLFDFYFNEAEIQNFKYYFDIFSTRSIDIFLSNSS